MKTISARLCEREGIRFWTLPDFERLGCRTAFFLRYGGVSRGAFRGLNLGLNTADEPERVLRNRSQAASAAGFQAQLPVVALQVHGTRLRQVTHRDAARGWQTLRTAVPGTDGLMTSEAGLPLAVKVADCLPVLFAADTGIAAVHAGWRGVAGEILPKTVRRFRDLWNVQPEKIWAAVGPGIGPEAFTVSGEALERLGGPCPECVCPRPDGTVGIDLWTAAERQLLRAGLPPSQIILIRDSTAAHPRKYFSHRRDHGTTGRMLGMIQRER